MEAAGSVNLFVLGSDKFYESIVNVSNESLFLEAVSYPSLWTLLAPQKNPKISINTKRQSIFTIIRLSSLTDEVCGYVRDLLVMDPPSFQKYNSKINAACPGFIIRVVVKSQEEKSMFGEIPRLGKNFGVEVDSHLPSMLQAMVMKSDLLRAEIL